MLYEKLDSELCEGVLQVPNFFCCLIILYPIKKLLKINPLSFFVCEMFLCFLFSLIFAKSTSKSLQVNNKYPIQKVPEFIRSLLTYIK